MKVGKIAYLHYFLTALILGLAISINAAFHSQFDEVLFQEPALVLLNLFGAGIIIISALGLLGNLLTAVQRNRTDLGVHMAVGADTGDIFRLVLLDTVLKHAALPVVLGSLSAQLVAVSGLLHMLDSRFPSGFDSAQAALCAVCALCFLLLCALYPAAAAAGIQPAAVLKGE